MGRPGAGRGRSGSARTTCSIGASRATSSRLDRHEQDRDPAGRRAAAAAAQPDHADERRQKPLPRFWYLPRGEKAVVVMSGDDHSPAQAPGGTAFALRPLPGAEPVPAASSPSGSASAPPPTSIPAPCSRTPRRAAYVAEGFEVALHPVVASCPTAADLRGGAGGVLRHAARAPSTRSTRASPAPVRTAPTASTGRTGSRTRRSSSRAGSGWTRNYYHYPGALDRRRARLHERRRLPDALRRPRRHARSTSTSRTRT